MTQVATIKPASWRPTAPPSLLDRLTTFARRTIRPSEFEVVTRRVSAATGSDASGIFSYCSPIELVTLYRLARSCPRGTIALEVGSHFGASACYIGTAMSQIGGMLYCVDTWGNETMPEGLQDTLAIFQNNTRGLGSVIRPIRKRSELLESGDFEVPLGFVFFDGDHSYESVSTDWARLEPWLGPKATVAFHDIKHFPGVSRCVGERLISNEWKLGGFIDNLVWLHRAHW